MLIASPPIIDEYVKSILYGEFIEPVKMRDDLAKEYQADKTCPVTTGIFLRIVSEASYEEYDNGIDLNTITPFWRMVNPNSKLAGKLACGIDFIAERHTQENRTDDNEEIAIKRYKTYEISAEPVLNYYKQSNLLKVVNGEAGISKINSEISGLIDAIKGWL